MTKRKDYPAGALLWKVGSGKDKFYTGKIDKDELIEKLERIKGDKVQFYLNHFDGEWKNRNSEEPDFSLTIKEAYEGGRGGGKRRSRGRDNFDDYEDDEDSAPKKSRRRYSDDI